MLEACASAVGAPASLVEAALRVGPAEGRELLRRDEELSFGDEHSSGTASGAAATAGAPGEERGRGDDLEAEIATALSHTLSPRGGGGEVNPTTGTAAAAAATASRALTDAGAAARGVATRAARTAMRLGGGGGACLVLAANDGAAAAECCAQLQRLVDEQVALAVGADEAARMRQLTSELTVQARQLTEWADGRARKLTERALCPAAAAAVAAGVRAIPAPHAPAHAPTSLGWASPLAEWAAHTGAVDAVGALLSEGPRSSAVRAVASAAASAAVDAAMGRAFDERGGLRFQRGARAACSLLEEALPGSGTLRAEFATCFCVARLLALSSLADAGEDQQQQQRQQQQQEQEQGRDGEWRRRVLARRVDLRGGLPQS